MKKLVQIEKCIECSHQSWHGDKCHKKNKLLPLNISPIPDWCELPDAEDLKRLERVRAMLENLKELRSSRIVLNRFQQRLASFEDTLITALEKALK